MTDVWTSAGVVLGVFLVYATGWLRLDAVVAFAVGINIIVTGWHLLNASVDGLMDHAWTGQENADLAAVLSPYTGPEVRFHALRTRTAGHRVFANVHVLVPGEWTVRRGHDLIEDLEEAVAERFPEVQLFTHLEPLEDPRSYDDFDTEVSVPHEGPPGASESA